MLKQALIFQGGWPGHKPKEVAEILAGWLRNERFEVEVADSLDCLLDADKLKRMDLIVPNWTMGTIGPDALGNLLQAVQNGTGLAGLHGGMGDAFRQETEYQFMVGGQFVAHPGGDGVPYTVHIEQPDHPITAGVHDFRVVSELYYMHVDPSIDVLAVWKKDGVTMPVAWTKKYGNGRVFYCSLGHTPELIQQEEVKKLVIQGMCWAARQQNQT